MAAVFPASPAEPVRSPLDVAFSPDGAFLAVTDATSPSVSILNPESRTLIRKIPLAAPPAGLAWDAASNRLFASESGAGTIAEITPLTATPVRRIATGRYPRGLAVAHRRNLLLATDWGRDRLTVIDLTSGKTSASIPVGRQPTSIAVSPDEKLALVSNLIPATPATAPDHAAEVSIIDLETMNARPAIRLPLGSTNARGIAISGDGSTAYVVHALGRFHLPTTQLDRGWVNTNAFSIINLKSGSLTATVLLDQMTEGAADPWGVAIDPAGMRLYITLSGVHQLAVIDLEGLPEILGPDPASLTNDLAALHRHKLIHRIDLPAKGPRGISVSPDGRDLAVASYFTGDLIWLDTRDANPQAISLGPKSEPDLIRLGEMIFHDANHCYQRWLSCSTCHPDARSDGLNWDLLNDGIGNPKNTRSMLYSHRTPPVMSLGVRASMEVAAHAGFVHIQFTQPKPDELAAVIAYLKSLEPVTSPHRKPDGKLTEAAARGEKIFHHPNVGCADCHPAPLFTDLAMSNVGTAAPQERGLTRLDTPTLIELWRNPPYLHDGSAATLREALTTRNPDDRHGRVSGLDDSQIEDLVQYLLSL